MRASRVPRDLSTKNRFSRDVLAAYREAVRRYAGKVWVTGITMGVKEIGGEADWTAGTVIGIHVRKKQRKGRVPRSRLIPRKILGIPTDVIEGDYVTSSNGAGSAVAVFPLRPGSSYARHDGTAATLAGVVRDKAGLRYLLSAAHTLREVKPFNTSVLMVHPGPADSAHPVEVARYEDVFLALDAGIARLLPDITVVNRALLSNTAILAPEMPVTGDVLEKSGEGSQLTSGEVLQIGTFDGVSHGMRIVLRPGDTGPISKPGDSGATWYDVTTSAAKGLHVGIDIHSNGRVAIASLFPEVMKKLKVTWELSS